MEEEIKTNVEVVNEVIVKKKENLLGNKRMRQEKDKKETNLKEEIDDSY